MPRVLRIINRFNLGGPTYNAGYLTKYLSPEFETKLIGGPNEESEADSLFILDSLGVEGEILPRMRRSINPLNDFLTLLEIIRIIRNYKPQIVHTHASKAGTLGRLAAWLCGVPVIVHTFHGHVFHSYFSSLKTNIFKQIEQFLARRSHAIIVISHGQKKELCEIHKIVPEHKAHVIPLGFDLSRFYHISEEQRKTFRSHYHIAENEVLIVIVGRLAPVKNHNMFLRVAKLVKEELHSSICRFMIVGDGETRKECLSKTAKLNLLVSTPENPNRRADVIFTSWIREVENVYAGADISVLTSFNEGTPVSIIESLASGVPVVTTNVGGISDIITNGHEGFLTEVDNDREFADKLIELIQSPEKRRAMGQAGRKSVETRFDFRRLVTDVINLYTNLLETSVKNSQTR